MQAYDRLKLARAAGRPTALDIIENVFDGFIELHGDRLFADDSAIIGGIARLNSRPVTVIATQKGRTVEEKVQRNFGSAHPEGYRKALRLMQQAEKFKRPIICIVDTSGAYCGIGAEERGQGRAIADNLMVMMRLKVPILSLISGEGGSGGALALAVANEVWMLENAIYSVISPEGAASILYKDASVAQRACEELKLTAQDLLDGGIIQRIFNEDISPERTHSAYKSALLKAVDKYSSMDTGVLLAQRYEQFRRIGRIDA